jgi:hypothetical protein
MTPVSGLPIVVSHDGVDVIVSGQPSRFVFIPRVQAEMTAAGDPTILLVTSAAGGLLQVGAHFDVDEAALRATRAALQTAVGPAAVFRLTPAPLTVRQASLVLTTPGGDRILAGTHTSSTPPYTALFRATLTPDQAPIVAAALEGSTHRLRVIYAFDIQTTAGATVRIEGDAGDAARAIGEPPSAEAAAAWIEEALAARRLTLEADQWGPESDGILSAATTACKAKAAAFVLRTVPVPGGSAGTRVPRLAIEARLEEPRAVPQTREGDVAGWFTGGRKARVIAQPVPQGSP